MRRVWVWVSSAMAWVWVHSARVWVWAGVWVRRHLDRIIELALLATLVVFGGIQPGINDRQGKITKKQTEIMDKQSSIMERQVKISEVVERPWVAIEGLDLIVPMIFKYDKAVLT